MLESVDDEGAWGRNPCFLRLNLDHVAELCCIAQFLDPAAEDSQEMIAEDGSIKRPLTISSVQPNLKASEQADVIGSCKQLLLFETRAAA